MTSAIDATQPPDGQTVSKALQRQNNAAAKAEITALQDLTTALLQASGLSSGDTSLPDFSGSTIPNGSSIVSAFQAIETFVEAISAGTGGASTLAQITDLNSPGDETRTAFQAPVTIPAVSSPAFTFDESAHAGHLLTLDTSTNSVVMTMPEATSLTREDGYLFSVVLTSGSNFAQITSDTLNQLRYQGDVFSQGATHTTLFFGSSRALGISSIAHVFLDGPVYRIEGTMRLIEASDRSFGAANTLNLGSAIVETLAAGAFPQLLDLGGTKRTGGGRNIERLIAGNGVLAQTDAGNILTHTGAGAAVWDVPDLLDGTTIEVENDGGAVTFNPTGAKTIVGGLLVAAGASAAVRYTNGKIRLVGTS